MQLSNEDQQAVSCQGEEILGKVIFYPAGYCVEIDNKKVVLTHTEFGLLKYLAENKGNVVSKVELQRQVLRKELGRFDRNLDMHISNTRRKLVNTCLPKSLINTVRGQGYSFTYLPCSASGSM